MNIASKTLGQGLMLRTAAGPDDIERVAQFNGLIHGAELAITVRRLLRDYAGMDGRDIVFVEDASTGKIISSLLLLPWTLSYGGASLPVGEMGMVGTLESHRGQGLVRAQTAYFMQRLVERGCLLSLIQGIPYFYRQFGYEYAMPLEGGLRLSGRELPAPPDTAFSFRPATAKDIPTLQRLYAAAARDLDIRAVRDEALWRYLLAEPAGSALRCETWLVEDAAGDVVGYFRLPDFHFDEELAVNEVSRLSGTRRWPCCTGSSRRPLERVSLAFASTCRQAAR
jgi:predicted N-acetyltransferase YhbS